MKEHFWIEPWKPDTDNPWQEKKTNNCYEACDEYQHNDWCERDHGPGYIMTGNENRNCNTADGCSPGFSKGTCRRHYEGDDPWGSWRNIPDDKLRVFSGVDGTRGDGSPGRYKDFEIGEYPNLDNWNDKIVSYAIPSSLNVSFYEHSNFQGAEVYKTGDNTFQNLTGDWRKRISSIKVYPRCEDPKHTWNELCLSCKDGPCFENKKQFCTDKNNVNSDRCFDWCAQNPGICDKAAQDYCKDSVTDNSIIFKQKASNKCLDGNGNDLYFGECNSGNSYINWYNQPQDDGYNLIKHKTTGKCLDGDGTKLYFNQCSNNNDYMKWKPITTKDGYANYQHKATGKCLDGDGKSLYFNECNDTNNYMNWIALSVEKLKNDFCGCFNFDTDTTKIINQLKQKGQTIIPTCNINSCVNNTKAYKPKQQGNCPSQQICLQGIDIDTVKGNSTIANSTFNCNQTSSISSSDNKNSDNYDNKNSNSNSIPDNSTNNIIILIGIILLFLLILFIIFKK